MHAIRIETIVQQEGQITVRHAPLKAGESVEIIILFPEKTSDSTAAQRYPLRGKSITLIDATEPVAQNDWGVL